MVINQLFGSVTGLGMSFLNFDWSQISWVISPLVVPWWALWQQFLGFIVFYWLVVPILYYKDVSSQYFSITQLPDAFSF